MFLYLHRCLSWKQKNSNWQTFDIWTVPARYVNILATTYMATADIRGPLPPSSDFNEDIVGSVSVNVITQIFCWRGVSGSDWTVASS